MANQNTHSIDKLTDCPYYLHDECSRGANCKYRHSLAIKSGQRKTCHKWEKNECLDINCINLHLKKSKTTKDNASKSQKQTKLIDCIYFLNGSCNRSNCKYRHSAEAIRNGICEEWCKGQCSNLNCSKRHPKNAPPLVQTQEEKRKQMEQEKMLSKMQKQQERNDTHQQVRTKFNEHLVEVNPALASVIPKNTPKRGARPYEMLLEKFAFNMGLYKGSHVSVGVSSNTNMPTLIDQLDSGITCLEIGIFSEVPGGADWRVGIEQPSSAPETLSLKHWLGVISTWSTKNPTHLPLVLLLDIKDDIIRTQSFGGGNMLVRIGNLISELFGTRVFSYQDFTQGKWPTVLQLRDRIIPVLSGSSQARQHYLGKGQEPAVTANKNGTIIQVCNKADQVCYFSGRYNQDGSVDWLHTGLVGSGRNPAVTINDDGFIIAVYESVSEFKLVYAIGKVLVNGDVSWMEPKEYDKGVTPSIALQPSGKYFVEVHKSQNNDNLWYHVGKFDAGNANNNSPHDAVSIDFGKGIKYPKEDAGQKPSVRFSATKPNRVEAIHLSTKTGKAWLWDGDFNPADGSIAWDMKTHAQVAEQPFKDKTPVPGTSAISVENKNDVLHWKTEKKRGIVKLRQQLFVEIAYPEESSWPEDFRKESSFVSVRPATDSNVVSSLKNEGKVVRMLHSNDQVWVTEDVKANASIIATDFPEQEKYHLAYLEVLQKLFKAQ